jgi:hypothetical protein
MVWSLVFSGRSKERSEAQRTNKRTLLFFPAPKSLRWVHGCDVGRLSFVRLKGGTTGWVSFRMILPLVHQR